jgi:hypothetical protein
VWLTREKRAWLSGRLVSAKWDVDELLAKKNEVEEQDLLKFGFRASISKINKSDSCTAYHPQQRYRTLETNTRVIIKHHSLEDNRTQRNNYKEKLNQT